MAFEKDTKGRPRLKFRGIYLLPVEEAELRWAIYRSIPRKDWLKMAERQPSQLADQAHRYGIPFDSVKVDLPAVVRAMHDFFTRYGKKIAQAKTRERLGNSTAPDHSHGNGEDLGQIKKKGDAYLSRERARIARLKRALLGGKLCWRKSVSKEVERLIHDARTLCESIPAAVSLLVTGKELQEFVREEAKRIVEDALRVLAKGMHEVEESNVVTVFQDKDDHQGKLEV